MFGKFIKEKRDAKGFSLRHFCRQLEETPGNWSKIENGKKPPPQGVDKLKVIAKILDIQIDSLDWNRFIDYARLDNAKLPDYITAGNQASGFLQKLLLLSSGLDFPCVLWSG